MSVSKLHPPEEGPDGETRLTRSVVVSMSPDSPRAWSAYVADLLDAGWDEVVVCAVVPDWETWETLSHLLSVSGVQITIGDTRRGAIDEGFKAASGDVLGYVAANHPLSVRELERVYRPVEGHAADLSVGVQNAHESDDGSLLGRVFETVRSQLRRWVAGVPNSALHPDAIAFSRDAWEGFGREFTGENLPFETELLVRAHNSEYSVEEVTIDRSPTIGSESGREMPAPLSELLRLRRQAGEVPRVETDDVRLGLVSCYPPHRGHLAEYGENLAGAYGRRDDVDLTVISCTSENASGVEFTDQYTVKRLWERDTLAGAFSILRELHAAEYDVVQFNIQMTYFGERNVHRFVGLALPVLAKLFMDATVVTTMHDFLEVADEDAIGVDVGFMERLGAALATQLVLLGDVTTVTSESFASLLRDRYYVPAIEHVPHGTFAQADTPQTVLDAPFRILVFGHLDPSKKDVETVIEAFEQVREEIPEAELWIAGDSHPGFPGYRERIEDQYADRPGVRFTGYVAEDELDAVWEPASMVVLPYRTCTGVSGVYQLAKTYATPVVAFDIDGIRESTVDTGGDAVFVEPGNQNALADEVLELREEPEQLLLLARENADASSDRTISDAADDVLELVAATEGDE